MSWKNVKTLTSFLPLLEGTLEPIVAKELTPADGQLFFARCKESKGHISEIAKSLCTQTQKYQDAEKNHASLQILQALVKEAAKSVKIFVQVQKEPPAARVIAEQSGANSTGRTIEVTVVQMEFPRH